jgi:hypothetical protein
MSWLSPQFHATDAGGCIATILELACRHSASALFRALRTDGLLWTRTVIWTSVLGSFLTIVGLYLGMAHYRGS